LESLRSPVEQSDIATSRLKIRPLSP
jgi:hypothetical protein